jgi:hypothetical protein
MTNEISFSLLEVIGILALRWPILWMPSNGTHTWNEWL